MAKAPAPKFAPSKKNFAAKPRVAKKADPLAQRSTTPLRKKLTASPQGKNPFGKE